jgi:WD40 repeat protein/serine/threonine protein kinase
MSDSSAEQQLLNDLAEEFADRQRRGERPSLSEYTDRYPHLAGQIRELFPALVMMEQVRPATADVTGAYDGPAGMAGGRLERLGDYRIVREVGRGGMGIVYEAEQISLGRHVALKVLPAAALLDPKRLRRFEREAKAAARLHHTNIVPVYGVGEDGGLHYYVMQFIPGLALDEVLAELRRLRQGRAAAPADGRTADASAAAQALLTGDFSVDSPARRASQGPPSPARPAGEGRSPADSSVHLPGQSEGSALTDTGRAYWQGVARIGVQVAEALAYASDQGILHRDIKPANLLLDGRGTVWVTDFGLARAAADTDNLTHTGDMVGTLRYMAPERFRGAGDARSDIYGLGLTLYELLTLRPAFPEGDRNRLIEQVVHAEPAPPRRLNPAVPPDLETVVLKAIDRDPARRYPTAAALADDLRRFLEDRPIRARRVSARERLWRWCRRNPVVAALAAALALVFLLGFAGVAWKWQEAERQKAAAQAAERKEGEQREIAVEQADRSRQLLYASDMTLAYQAFEAGDTGRARALLERHWPQAGQEDLRGFEWRYLWRGCRDGSRQTLRGHTAEVRAVAFSRDGKLLASCGQDHSVRIWDVASRRHTKLLGPYLGSVAMGSQVGSVAFAPDGKTLAIVQDHSKSVRLWDVAARCERAALPHPSEVAGVTFSPDGKLLATGGSDGTVRLWDVATWREVGTLGGHTDGVLLVVFSPDGKTLASAAYYDTAIRLWDMAARRQIASLKGHTTRMSSLSFSPDGKTLASAAHETAVRLWDVAAKKEVRALREPGTLLSSVAFSPDGKVLATGGGDGTVRVWDAGTGEVVSLLRGHTGAVTAVAFASEGRSLVSGSMDGTIKVWDVALRPDPNTLAAGGVCLSVDFSPGGKTLAVGTLHGNPPVRLWDVASRQQVAFPRTHEGQVWCVTFAPGGQILATASRDKTVRIWEVGTQEQLAEFQHLDWVQSVDFSPDGKLLAAGCVGAETVLVWDLNNRRKVAQLVGSWVRFSPDGTRLAASSGNTVRLWEVATWQNVGALTGNLAEVTRFAFAPDGRTLVTGDVDGALHLWDVARKRRVASRRGHAWHVRSVTFSPDGRRVATSGRDSTVKLWDAALLQEVATLTGHDGPVMSVAFSPDGNTLATAGVDAAVRLREAPPLPAALREPVDAASVAPTETIRLFRVENQGTAQATRTPDGDAHRVDITAVDDTDWHAQLVQAFDDLEEGATYTIRFRAKADAPRRLTLVGQILQPDWHSIGLSKIVPLIQDWQPYRYEFRAKDLAATNKIGFFVGERTGTVWIADFSVTKGAK